MREIHFSELQAWMRCRRKWWNRYHERLVEPTTPENFTLGSLWHLLAPTCNVLGYEAANDLGMRLAHDQRTDGENMLIELLYHYHHWWPKQNITIKEIETEHRWELPELNTSIVCTPDGVVEWRGGLWILERKTSSKLETGHLFLDPQGLTYSMAVPDVMGVLYEFTRKSRPDKTKLDLFALIPRRIGAEARSVWKKTVVAELALLEANRGLESMMSRNFNPISYMKCGCEFEDKCMAELMGRDGLDMYRKIRDDEDRPREYPSYHDLEVKRT